MFERNVIILAILGYFGAMFKGAIGQAFHYMSLSLRSKIVVDSESPLYAEAVRYVNTLNAQSLKNNVKLSNTYSRRESRFTITASPDDGNYLITQGKLKWMIISMTRQSLMDRELFRISFTFIGRGHEKRSSTVKVLLNNDMEIISVTHGIHSNSSSLREKTFDTIFIENKNYILNKIDHWRTSKEFYNKHQIPYKLGILLSGAPGTGKTSFIIALAYKMRYNVVIIPKVDLDRPIHLMSNLLSKTIYVLEDVDRMIASSPSDPTNRDIDITELYPTSGFKHRSVDTQMPASMLTHTLLQLLDGVTTPDNVIFVLTTNNKDSLDPAIYRPGRIALDIELDNISEELATSMVESYGLTKEFIIDEEFPINPSYLQNKILLAIDENNDV